MSISSEILRIQNDRNTMRTKLVDLGLVISTADLDDIATAVDGITNQGAVSAQFQEGDTYTIPKGYHNGSGTVSGVAGGGNYSLQSKTITPTKAQQSVTPDNGYFGLSDVTVAAIPENYQDVTPVTATAADVLANKVFVDSTGKSVAGTMPNNGALNKTLTPIEGDMLLFEIPRGYHNGSGKIFVESIPETYHNTSNVDATEETVLNGKTFVDSLGNEVTGTMPDIGAVTASLNTSTTSYTVPKGYHNGSGKVSITTETKSATPTKSAQTITPTSGKVLSKVTVSAIPAAYQDVTNVTATADKVLEGSKFVDSSGKIVNGTMVDRSIEGSIDTLTVESPQGFIPIGYYDGRSYIDVASVTKEVTPTKSMQTITGESSAFLSSVTVNAIPTKYQDVSGVTATADNVLDGKYIVLADGTKVEGTMPNNGATSSSIDGLTKTSVTIPAGYTSGGTVSLTSDIEEALAAI